MGSRCSSPSLPGSAISPRPHSSLTSALPRQANLTRLSRAGNGRQRKGKGMPTNKRRLGMGVALVAGLVAAGVATLAPTAGAQKEPGRMSGDRPTVLRLQGVNFIGNCTFSHRNTDDPIVFAQHARRVPRPQLRGQPDDERVLDDRLAARRPDDLPPLGGDRGVLDADALRRRQRRRRRPAPRSTTGGRRSSRLPRRRRASR